MWVDGLQSSSGRTVTGSSPVPRRAAKGTESLPWMSGSSTVSSATLATAQKTAPCLDESAMVRLVTLNESLSLPATDEQMWREAEKSFVTG